MVGFPTERKVNPDASKFRTTPAARGTTKLTVNLNFPSLPFRPAFRVATRPSAPTEREREREREEAVRARSHIRDGNRATPLRNVNYKALDLPGTRQGSVTPACLCSPSPLLPPGIVIFNEKKLIRDQS